MNKDKLLETFGVVQKNLEEVVSTLTTARATGLFSVAHKTFDSIMTSISYAKMRCSFMQEELEKEREEKPPKCDCEKIRKLGLGIGIFCTICLNEDSNKKEEKVAPHCAACAYYLLSGVARKEDITDDIRDIIQQSECAKRRIVNASFKINDAKIEQELYEAWEYTHNITRRALSILSTLNESKEQNE